MSPAGEVQASRPARDSASPTLEVQASPAGDGPELGRNPVKPFPWLPCRSTMERPRRLAPVAVAALLAAVALAAVPVAAHVNHASADPQVSENGTVVVETVYIATDGWVVLHRDDGGSPGEAIGHARVREAGGLKEDVAVGVDDSAWRDWSTRTVWATLHRDRGDDSFDPDEDPPITSFDRPSGEQFTLARGERAVVTAAGFAPQRSDGNVTVRRATLPRDGHVVVHNGSVDGAVVGTASRPAGTHRNVTVALDDAFVRSHGRATLVATLYADDGDGRFGDGDSLVRAGDAPVATTFAVRFGGNGSATPTGSLVTTATPGGDGGAAGTADGDTETPTDGGGPGFGVAGGLAALVALGLGLATRRRG